MLVPAVASTSAATAWSGPRSLGEGWDFHLSLYRALGPPRQLGPTSHSSTSRRPERWNALTAHLSSDFGLLSRATRHRMLTIYRSTKSTLDCGEGALHRCWPKRASATTSTTAELQSQVAGRRLYFALILACYRASGLQCSPSRLARRPCPSRTSPNLSCPASAECLPSRLAL